MDQTIEFYAVGRQLKRTLIAFVLANFIVYLQVWFAIEVVQLARELERVGRRHGFYEFKKSSKLLLGARAAAIVAFILGIVATMTAYAVPFGSASNYLYNYYYEIIIIVPFIRVIPILIELTMVSATWKCLYQFFNRDEFHDSQSRALGLKSTMRVRWAMGVTIAATVIGVVASNIGFENQYSSYCSNFYLVPAFLMLVSIILMLLGTSNAGVGMYDTSRAFLAYQDTAYKRPQPEEMWERQVPARTAHNAYRELPFHPDNLIQEKGSNQQYMNTGFSTDYSTEHPKLGEKIRYCYNCGTLLPQVPGLRFCPNCGVRVN